MDPDIKQRWVAALRSGEYPQTTGRLRADDAYCCLGVLCDLYDSSGWVKIDPGSGHIFQPGGAVTALPADVCLWAGLDSGNPEVGVPEAVYNEVIGADPESDKDDIGHVGCVVLLSDLNDIHWTFDRIADVIEERL